MFIKTHQHPTIELNPDEGQASPTIVHFFSDRADPFKTALPQLIAGADQADESVLVVESPLSEIMDWTIELHRHPDFPDQVIMDKSQRPFFDEVKRSLLAAVAKIDGLQYAAIDDLDEED